MPKPVIYEIAKRGIAVERTFDLRKSDEQVFLYKNNPPAFVMSARFKGVEPVLRDLGMPNLLANQYYSRIFSGLESFKYVKSYDRRYKKYPVEIFGARVPSSDLSNLLPVYQPIPDNSQFSYLPRYLYESYYFLIEIWRIRI